jgi:uncharacterized protein (TIGR00369 family)
MSRNPFAFLKAPQKAAAALLPSANDLGRFVRDAWARLSTLPGGRAVFSTVIGLAAPYTGTIGAEVLELSRGHAKVVMKDRRHLRNHLSSVHAVALVNLAELTGNIALAYSMPDDARFIVAGISIDYHKKARGAITGVCTCPIPETSARQEYLVPVELLDAAGSVVATASLKTLIGPIKAA